MKIFIYFPIIADKAGVAFYTEDLTNAMLEESNENIEFTVLTNKRGIEEFNFIQKKNLRLIPLDIENSIDNIKFQAVGLRKLIKQEKPDIMFFPSNPLVVSKVPGVTYVSTIHDLNELEDANKYSFSKSFYRRKIMLPASIHNSDHLITISDFSYRQLQTFFPNSLEKVEIIHNGVRTFDKKSKSKSGTKIREKILLCVGRVDVKGKNLENVVKVFEKMKEKDPDYRLLFLGGDYGDNSAFKEETKKKLKDAVEFKGFVSDEELEHYLGISKFIILFSKREGFGLPAFEGLASGLPVIINKECQVLNDLIGDVSITLNENLSNIDHLYEFMGNLEKYDQLKELGKKRANEFTWEEAARKTLTLMEKAVQSPVKF